MDSETYLSYDKIIKNEVYNYLRARGLSLTNAEDMIQDCWMNILEYNKKYGRFPDYSLAKTMAHRRIVDILRKEYGSNAHFSLNTASSGDDYDSDHNTWMTDTSNNDMFDVDLKELRSMFPDEESPERKFIEFYISKAGLNGDIIPDKTRTQGGYTDSNLAKSLGFAGTADRRWKNFRDHMRSIIADYFG